MGNIFLVKRASRASEAFSLMMKTNNCLRLRVLTRNTRLHLVYVVYVSSTGVCVLNWCTCPHLANMSSPRIDAHVFQWAPLLSMRTKNYAPTVQCWSPLKAWMVTVVWTDATMPCLSKAFQWDPLHETNNYKKAKMKAGWQTIIGNELARFLMGTILLVGEWAERARHSQICSIEIRDIMRLSMLSPTFPLRGKIWGGVGIRQNRKSNAPTLGQY